MGVQIFKTQVKTEWMWWPIYKFQSLECGDGAGWGGNVES